MINKVTLVGNLGKDAETNSIGDNTITKLSVATSQGWKDKSGEWQEKTEWHAVEIWNASQTVKDMKKAQQVFVDGSIEYQSTEGEDGSKRYFTKIKARTVRALGLGSPQVQQPVEQPVEDDMPF